MLITSHIASTLIVGKLIGLNQAEWIVAFIGSVAIDIDHLFINLKWLTDTKYF